MGDARDRPQSPIRPDDPLRLGIDLSDDGLIERLRAAAAPAQLGRIGGYELISVAGRGGQGVVYRARQSSTGREVALKHVRLGSSANEAAHWRFAREVEIEASLRHPHIVTVYGLDWVDGQPLLALEWIDGVHLDRWAHPNGPEAAGRRVDDVVGLFLKICGAVIHAHQRGVIHRDLKPSNILVDPAGEPRVLDFGLAKLLDESSKQRHSATGGFLGTLDYAAPEQVRGDSDAIDVRTDVFALGCVLYQCLTGRSPFGGLDDLEAATRAICTEEPASSRLRNPGVDGDLDAIVSRALAKEREQRYPSVEALSADLRRFLGGEPVEARRGSRWYYVRKFVKRNRTWTAAAFAGAICLALGGALATNQGLRIRAHTRDAAALNDFLLELLGAADAFEPGKPLAGVEFLDRAAANLTPRFGDLPLRQAAARVVIGKAYQSCGQLAKAEEQLRTALETRRRLLGDDNADTLAVGSLLGDVVRAAGRFQEARELLREAVEGQQRILGPGARETLLSMSRLSMVLSFLGEPVEAERQARTASEGLDAIAGPDHRDSIWAATRLSNQVAWNGRLAEAESIARGTLERAIRGLGADHPRTLSIRSNLAATLCASGRLDESDDLIRAALSGYRAHVGEENPDAANALEVLGMIQCARGQLGEAERTYRRVVDTRTRVIGEHNIRTLITDYRLVNLLRWRDALEEALSLARTVHDAQVAAMGEVNPWTLQFAVDLAMVLAETGKPHAEEAEELASECLTRLRQVHPANELLILQAGNALSLALRAKGEAEFGERTAAEILARRDLPQQLTGALHVTRSIRGGCLLDLGRLEEADLELRAARAGFESLTAADFFQRYHFPSERTLLRDLISVSERRGDPESAERWRRELEEALARTR